MRVREKNRFVRKKRIIVAFCIFIITFSMYVGSVVFILNDILSEMTIGEVDSSGFLPFNRTALKNGADKYEFYLARDHLPMDFPLTANWNLDFTEIEYYSTDGDAAGFTGNVLGAEAYRYAIAKRDGNVSEMTDSLEMVKRVLHGASLLLAVPNGGIGPEYGAILARSVLSPEYSGPPLVSYQDETSRGKDVFNGTGTYSEWLWIGYPSVDQYCNLFYGLSRVAVDVSPDDSQVNNLTRLLTQQMIDGLIRTNWLLSDEGGRTTGQEMEIGIECSAYWVLGALKLAILANPDIIRYQNLYYHYAYERDYIHQLKPHIPTYYYNFMNFYSHNLQWMMIFTLMAEETDPFLYQAYRKVLEEDLYPSIRLTRNAWFNIAYLALIREPRPNIALDITDQLMRFTIPRPPNNSSRIPARGGDISPILPEQFGRPRMAYWESFITQNPIGTALYGWMHPLFFENQDLILHTAKTVDQFPPVDTIWERNPWNIYEIPVDPIRDPYRQDVGYDYLMVYYMADYYQIFIE
jgi:hypothetical protein